MFAVENIKKGEKFSNKNIKSIRPGHGLEPKYYFKLLGKKSPYRLSKGQPIQKKIIKSLKLKKL